MQLRPVANTELQLSRIAIGGWLTLGGSVADAEALRILHAAVAAGVNFIDLADVYARGGAERLAGRFLKEHGDRGLIISSKVFWPMSDEPGDRGLGRAHIHQSIDATLQRLGRDHVELYFCHREDPATPLEETAQAMHDLVKAGKVRHWGTSCWRASTLHAVHVLCKERQLVPPRVEQPPYSLLERGIEGEVIPATQALKMGVVVWSPLCGGVLTGKYNDGVPPGSRGATTQWVAPYLQPEILGRVREFCALAEAHGVAPAVLGLAWAADQPGITTAISGASTMEQVRTNLAAADFKLTPELQEKVTALFPRPKSTVFRRLLRGIQRRLPGKD
jgi:aryl-alcohol dehydrogenase-like predicted oxidoreductase